MQLNYCIQVIPPYQACKVQFIIYKSMLFCYDLYLLFATYAGKPEVTEHPASKYYATIADEYTKYKWDFKTQ